VRKSKTLVLNPSVSTPYRFLEIDQLLEFVASKINSLEDPFIFKCVLGSGFGRLRLDQASFLWFVG
jgi:hypothetical protein